MKHLLFVLEYYAPHRGGAETCFQELIERLQHRYHITIITTHYDSSLPRHEHHGNISLYRVWSSRRNLMWHALRFSMSFFRGKKKPDLIHSSTFTACIAAFILSRLRSVPLVVTVHEVFGAWRQHFKWFVVWGFLRIAEHFLLLLPWDHIHTPSVSTINAVRQHTVSQQMSVIHRGVNTDKRQGPRSHDMGDGDASNKKLLYIGHTGESKGVEILLDAMPSLLQATSHSFHLNVLPNTDKHHTKIMQRITDLAEESSRVTYSVNVPFDTLKSYVDDADAVIVPSLSEWFCFVAGEMSHCHKDLIVSHTASLPEVASGRLWRIQPNNVPSLIDALLRWTDKRESPDEVVPYKTFSWDKTVQSMEALYQWCRKK